VLKVLNAHPSPEQMPPGYFRKRAKITTRIRTTRRKALITSRIGSISCSLLGGGETAGGENTGAAGLGGSMAGA
jgi:hypothetical protein